MAGELTLQNDEFLPLREIVFNTLREAILRGTLKPGERLMETQLAAKLGVSRTPVREAIHMLEQEGLAETHPKRGATVAAMTIRDMEDVLEIRETLEELAVRLACDRIDEYGIGELAITKQEFEDSLQMGSAEEIAVADERFHDVIFRASGNPRLVAMLENLRSQIYRYRLAYLRNEANYPALLEEHLAIYDGIVHHEKQNVASVMQRHIAGQIAAVKLMIEEEERNEGHRAFANSK